MEFPIEPWRLPNFTGILSAYRQWGFNDVAFCLSLTLWYPQKCVHLFLPLTQGEQFTDWSPFNSAVFGEHGWQMVSLDQNAKYSRKLSGGKKPSWKLGKEVLPLLNWSLRWPAIMAHSNGWFAMRTWYIPWAGNQKITSSQLSSVQTKKPYCNTRLLEVLPSP